MPVNTSTLSWDEIEKWFTRTDPVPPHTFELALTLGGTVSAGGYTAGALDFLIEALDAWTAARDNPETKSEVPQHKVVLRVVTGSSGGGVIAAIAGRALNFDFAPVSNGGLGALPVSGNPLYDTWVHTLTLDGFLQTHDLTGGLASVLSGQPIDGGKGTIAQYRGTPRRAPRPWLGAPLRQIITLTNLRGVPYKLPFAPDREEVYVDHADYIRYAITYDGQLPTSPPRPDELQLNFGTESAENWTNFAQFACGTAAFPAGFPPRQVSRPTEHYRYRVVRRAPDDPTVARLPAPNFEGLEPDWAAFGDPVPETYDFVVVDGGATDNEPIELARTALCGVGGSNPRAPKEANRAVLLIDPFAGKSDLGPSQIGKFVAMLGAFAGGVIQQARCDSRDLMLAADPNVLSRFMLTPNRTLAVDGVQRHLVGTDAIASAGLGAFIGFAHSSFMHHDYMLGRTNCANFLRRDFTLPCDGAVMDGQWTEAQKTAFGRDVSQSGHVPIIPLVGRARQPQPTPPWPAGQLNPENYRFDIRRRFRGVLGTFGFRGKAAAIALQCSAADYAIDAIKAYLAKAHL